MKECIREVVYNACVVLGEWRGYVTVVSVGNTGISEDDNFSVDVE